MYFHPHGLNFHLAAWKETFLVMRLARPLFIWLSKNLVILFSKKLAHNHSREFHRMQILFLTNGIEQLDS